MKICEYFLAEVLHHIRFFCFSINSESLCYASTSVENIVASVR